MTFPATRLRRLRTTPAIRDMVRETRVTAHDLIMPVFAPAAPDTNQPLPQIHGMRLLSGAPLAAEAREIQALGIPAVLVFGMPNKTARNDAASAAHAADGPIQDAVRTLKRAAPGLTVITDLCLCEFTDHGHCGLLRGDRIDNDATLACLQRAAVSHAEAGADVIAPSGMMDGVVRSLRQALDDAGHTHVLTMPYSAKFASGFYGPFKSATDSIPGESRHATHQLDPANADQALHEIELDIGEGADIIMVKPALPSLDILRAARERFPAPLAAYQVSGVYNMLWQAAEGEDRHRLMSEILTCIKRAGADMIVTYYAKQAASR